MTGLEMPETEPVYIAGTVSEAEAVEALFAEQQIEYEVRPAEFRNVISLGAVFVGVSFRVLRGQASYCRFILADRGFKKGIVDSDQE